MSKRFTACYALLITDEGGYADRPLKADPGGTTNWGVTIARWGAWVDRPVTKDEMRNLTPNDVAPFYERWYWEEPGCHKMPVGADYCLFDAYVMHSPAGCGRIIQRACRDAGFNPGKIDGVIGTKTIGAVNDAFSDKSKARRWLDLYNAHRVVYCSTLSNWADNRLGWAIRFAEVIIDAVDMIEGRPVQDR